MADHLRNKKDTGLPSDAAAHDAWFRAEVEEALRDCDDPAVKWIPDDEAKEDAARRRAALLQLMSGRE